MSGNTNPSSAHFPQRSDGIIEQEAGGVVILLNLNSGAYYSLNESGGRIWRLCGGRVSQVEIVRQLAEYYGGLEAGFEADVADLLQALAHENLLRNG